MAEGEAPAATAAKEATEDAEAGTAPPAATEVARPPVPRDAARRGRLLPRDVLLRRRCPHRAREAPEEIVVEKRRWTGARTDDVDASLPASRSPAVAMADGRKTRFAARMGGGDAAGECCGRVSERADRRKRCWRCQSGRRRGRGRVGGGPGCW
mmetsp:Transcript_5299/g.10805  ORF Transcript_5299/g.10805 Transcript_5299/m.10805 type:complete len:154 (-) Transcript_5299:1121-1582(-)